MSVFSDAEKTSMRAHLALYRGETCTVLRPTLVAGVEDWQAVTTYPCRRTKGHQPPMEREYTGKTTSITSVFFHLPYDASILPSDRLQVGTQKYEILGADEPNTVADLERIVHCQKIV